MMEKLMGLQQLEFSARRSGKESERDRLRAAIPEPILAHFDRLIARGKKGVATVRQAVCSECHIRIPTGTLVTLAHGTDIQVCGSCGRYLYLPANEPLVPTPKQEPRKAAQRKAKDSALAHA
jgi:predicted  nucleic acid-binding Zn-ribbon protein